MKEGDYRDWKVMLNEAVDNILTKEKDLATAIVALTLSRSPRSRIVDQQSAPQ